MESTQSCDKYAHWNLKELKTELRKRNARVSGRKQELLNRLADYDRNQNFGKTENLDPEYLMTTPDPSSYLDVNCDSVFSGTTLDDLTTYLAKYDKQLDMLIQRMYSERTIRYFRVSTDKDFTYVSSSCYAEYRKGVTYDVDVQFDKNGSIQQAQCDCPAGEGPGAHCKHVCVVLYASVMFQKHRDVKIEETCTQKLQSFHKAKRFIGSPLKAQDINMPGADEFTNLDFDPRPEHLRNDPGYEDNFRNKCLNFSGISKMPIFQLFKPANAFAVAHDHDYLKLTPQDRFLERINLLNITQEKIDAIEERTRGQINNVAWKEERMHHLPSSMYGRICKATDRTDFVKLARSLTHFTDIKTAPLEHGRKYESFAIQKYMSDTGCIVKPCGLFVSMDFPHLSSSPDGIVTDKSIIEVKCPYVSRDKPINSLTVPYLKQTSKSGYTLDPNHDYYFQIQGQLLCTSLKECTLIVCHANDLKYH
ncbi:uncharacterized protein [Argopecten irradians]|uniref:uncharacterized protein n=1 Tax=Argopecten irradians TaxID=31199 RepID=UPI003716AC01